MKKFVLGLVALAMLLSSMSVNAASAESKRLNVVATIFPIYDWVREVVGDNENVDLTLLLDSGVDLHSYQPTAQDILKVAQSDLFIYVGGESDEWVEGALAQSVNPDMRVINLVEAMGDDIKMEEIVEGMEHEHDEHDHDEDEHEEGDHDEEEADEHVWLSLRNAEKLVSVIAGALSEIDPSNAATYTANCEAFIDKLVALDAEYAAAVQAATFDTLLFGDRFPFRYMVDDYGLNYYAAFSGCSAESEASFETIVFLAGKVDELGLTTVLTIEGGNRRIAETVVQTTQAKSQKVLSMDSLQSITAKDVADGKTYLSVMADNLSTLIAALSE